MTESNTFVFRGKLNPTEGKNPFHQEFCGLTPSAWCRGEALADKDELEDFIRECRDGKFSDIEEAQEAASALMDKQGFA